MVSLDRLNFVSRAKEKNQIRRNQMAEIAQDVAAAGVGAGAGALVVEVAGLSAVGAVGSGAGIGMAAGPAGMLLGGLTGLALLGIARGLYLV
jgi:hypothetical protein